MKFSSKQHFKLVSFFFICLVIDQLVLHPSLFNPSKAPMPERMVIHQNRNPEEGGDLFTINSTSVINLSSIQAKAETALFNPARYNNHKAKVPTRKRNTKMVMHDEHSATFHPYIQVFLRGRLGNNLFQVAWALSVAEITGYTVVLSPYTSSNNSDSSDNSKESSFRNTLLEDRTFLCFPFLVQHVERNLSNSLSRHQFSKNFASQGQGQGQGKSKVKGEAKGAEYAKATKYQKSIEIVGDKIWIDNLEENFKSQPYYQDKNFFVVGYMQNIVGIHKNINKIRKWFALDEKCSFDNIMAVSNAKKTKSSNVVSDHEPSAITNGLGFYQAVVNGERSSMSTSRSNRISTTVKDEQSQFPSNILIGDNDIVIHFRDYKNEFISQFFQFDNNYSIEKLQSKFVDMNQEYYDHVLIESIKWTNRSEQQIWIVTPSLPRSCPICKPNRIIKYLQSQYEARIFDSESLESISSPGILNGELITFSFLQKFHNIVIAHSTFSWWAAYLSLKSSQIHISNEGNTIPLPPRDSDDRYRLHYSI